MSKKGGLGKGLDALFTDNNTERPEETDTLRLDLIVPNKDQPRKQFDAQEIEALVESIRIHGVVQPLIVRPKASGHYEIVAGERRWRACKKLALSEVPVIIRDMDDQEAMEISLIENLQRQDLNPVEEAQGYRTLMDRYNMTQEEAATRVGKSRATVANMLRLLTLPSSVVHLLSEGRLSAGQAKAILSFSSEKERREVAERAADSGLTVRELEKMARKQGISRSYRENPFAHNEYKEFEVAMQSRLGRKVRVHGSKEGKGTLTLEFYSKEDLQAISRCLDKMGKGER